MDNQKIRYTVRNLKSFPQTIVLDLEDPKNTTFRIPALGKGSVMIDRDHARELIRDNKGSLDFSIHKSERPKSRRSTHKNDNKIVASPSTSNEVDEEDYEENTLVASAVTND